MNNPFSQLESEGVYSKYGTMVYDLVIVDNKETEFVFMVKEETKYINRHKYRPSIQLRTGLLNISGVWIIPFMILINQDFDMLYETVFNYYQTGGGKKYFDVLKKQEYIDIMFFDEKNENARNIRINNQLQNEITEYNMRVASIKPWSMNQFDKAKQKMFEKYLRPTDLWNELGNKK